MTCGVLCRREIDYKPLSRYVHLPEQESDWIDKALRGFFIFLCIINAPVLITAALLAEFVL